MRWWGQTNLTCPALPFPSLPCACPAFPAPGPPPSHSPACCRTSPHRADLDSAQRENLLGSKRRGEAVLRNSGLGYTVVRPGPLVEEAGGYKALVFDQGNRISQAISCADVADVCLKALHNPEARNKTFEVGMRSVCAARWSGRDGRAGQRGGVAGQVQGAAASRAVCRGCCCCARLGGG